ncbi:hypothetical protein GCM10020254_76640 [Streptomyces goshikiensis]
MAVEVAAQFALEGLDVLLGDRLGLQDAVGVHDHDVWDRASAPFQFLGDLEGEVAAERVPEERAGAVGPELLDEVGVARGLVLAVEVVEGDEFVLGQVRGEAAVDQSVAAGRREAEQRGAPAGVEGQVGGGRLRSCP